MRLMGRETLRIAIEHSNDAVSIIHESRINYVNRKFLEVWGYDDMAEVLGKPVADFIPPGGSRAGCRPYDAPEG